MRERRQGRFDLGLRRGKRALLGPEESRQAPPARATPIPTRKPAAGAPARGARGNGRSCRRSARFAEFGEQRLRAAAVRNAKPRHRLAPLARRLQHRIVAPGPGGEPVRQLAPLEEQERARFLAVAPGAADLLIITLDGVGASTCAT